MAHAAHFFRLVSGIALIPWLTTAAPAVVLHVAPNGLDAWSGIAAKPNAAGTDGPVATLAGARDAVRKFRASHTAPEPVRIVVAAGTYALTDSVRMEAQDGGTADAPVSYEAAPGATPVFSGGRLLTGWQPGPGGVWQTQVPAVAAGTWYFEQLWVNGRRATRARTPNTSWHRVHNVTEDILEPSKGPHAARAKQTLTVGAAECAPLASLDASALKDVNLVVYHKWDNTRRFVDAVNPSNHTLTITGEGMKPWNRMDGKSTWIAENARAFLDAPGEWFLARDGTLSYLPLPGEDMAKAEVVAPVVEKFLILTGDPAGGRSITHLSFKGLAFRHAQWLTPPGGFEPCQAAAALEAAVMIDHAQHVLLENCEFGHLGTYGVWFRRGCRDSALRHCWIPDFGAGGVRIGEAAMPAGEAAQTHHITLDNNIIHHGGHIFPCAVGVWIGFSPDNHVTRNEIADLFYTGISMGWRWGYDESNCKRNTISGNHVHHLGKGLLSDLGGIYTLGPSQGSVVTHNVFHDIDAYSYGGWGLYTDEGSSGILFENNLVYHTKTGGFHQHYGKDNTVRNNIFVDGREHQLQATRAEPHLSFTFERNIIYWDHPAPALAGAWDKMRVTSGQNCYWSTRGPVQFLGRDLSAWQAAGHEQKSLVADPGFMNPEKLDFRLHPGSPALGLGFKPFDPGQAGVYGSAAWIARAKE